MRSPISQYLFNSETSEVIGWTILHSIWQLSLFAAVFAIVRWWMSRRDRPSAQAIYWLGCVTMVFMTVVPVATFLVIEPSPVSAIELAAESRNILAHEFVDGTSESRFMMLPGETVSGTNVEPVQLDELGRGKQAGSREVASVQLTVFFRRWTPWLTSIWFVGVLLFLIRPLLGLWNVQRLKSSSCSILSDPIFDVARRAAERMGLGRAVRFASSKKIEIPTVVGYWRPIVLFPLSALTELTPAQLEMIVVHELAHIRRHDYLVNLFQAIIESVLFYHPCVWWVSTVVRAERENCCDDVAVEISSPKEYATALLALENARPVAVPALAANGGNLVSRVRRMMSIKPGRSTQQLHQRAPWASSVLALLVLTTLVFVGHGSLVATVFPHQTAQENGVENPEEIRKDFAKTTLGKILDKEMEKLKQVGFSGSVLVAHKGEIILAKSEGFRDLEGKKSIKPHTLFELASFSKSFTSTLAMILAQQGKLDLDASIADYLPEVPADCKKITVRHLMQHTSGIPNVNYGRTDADLATAVKTMLAGGPKTEPGAKHLYWNQGYILLSEVIAKAGDKPFIELSKELIFDPCGMTGTCFNGDKAPQGFQVSTGTGQLGAPRTCLEHPYGKIELVYQGTGGIVSNVHDVWKFHTALMGGELLNEKSKSELFDVGAVGGYSLGWRVGETSGGETRHSHGGRVRGFNCNFARYPKSDSCIVVLSNNDQAPSVMVTNVIEGILFPAKMPQALDAKLAEKCVGKYKDAKGRVLEIEKHGQQVTYAIFWEPENPNAPVSRGYLQKNDSGEIVMYQPGDVSVVELVLNEAKTKVEAINDNALDLKFNRTK